jgi:hypothetical protein
MLLASLHLTVAEDRGALTVLDGGRGRRAVWSRARALSLPELTTTAGTNGIAVHIPPGFPSAPKLPDKDDELFMGSSTVVADDDPLVAESRCCIGDG